MNELIHTGIDAVVAGMCGFILWKLRLIDKHETSLAVLRETVKNVKGEFERLRSRLERHFGWTPAPAKRPSRIE